MGNSLVGVNHRLSQKLLLHVFVQGLEPGLGTLDDMVVRLSYTPALAQIFSCLAGGRRWALAKTSFMCSSFFFNASITSCCCWILLSSAAASVAVYVFFAFAAAMNSPP